MRGVSKAQKPRTMETAVTDKINDPHSTPDRTPNVRTLCPADSGNRGKRAKDGTGVVEGSGAGAGGGGNPEDYDSDDAGGGSAQ